METLLQESLSDVIREIIKKPGNAKVRKLFYETISNLKFSECEIHTGWISGEYIVFDCLFTKGGNTDFFNLFEKTIKNKSEIFAFISGLNPNIFYYNSSMTFNELRPNQYFISFKLLKNDVAKKRKTNL